MTQSRRSLEELRASLAEAARDGFARVMDDALATRMRAAADQVLEGPPLDAPWDDQLRRFRGGLDRFEERGRHDRSRVVAHGLRICMAIAPRAVGRPTAKRSTRRGVQGAVRGSAAASSTEASAVPSSQPNDGRSASPRAQSRAARVGSPTGAGRLAPVSSLPGVGPKTAEKLEARGICTLEDLLYLLPRGYQDRRVRHRLEEAEEGQFVVLEGVIRSFRQGWFRGRYSASMRIEQEGGAAVEARWFHPVGGLTQRVQTGEPVLAAGTIKRYRGQWSMVHPELYDAEAGGPAIAVRYPAVEGLGARTLARLCAAALDRLREAAAPEVLPAELRERHGLLGQLDALESLHQPDDGLDAEAIEALSKGRSPGHRRLAFEELFFLQLALLRHRARWKTSPCALPDVVFDRERIRACLPFEPTGAQWRSLNEIEGDLGSGAPMLRLLQGDVGSGKTAVAFGAALAVASAGGQVALMAPTEILAEQHLRTMSAWCERAGLRVALLTGSTPRAQRNSLLALLAAGRVDLLVGTHALLVGGVEFARLGLVIVDEQHRFGVEQRTRLREKGEAPHLLVMTATPIPRSLALTAFGELDVSVIDELPPGREHPQTTAFHGKRGLSRARRELCLHVEAGAQAFVVCPLVEASEAVAASDVEATAQALQEALPGRGVGIVHGRMTGREKDEVMSRFRAGELAVLVATTVIEVGVDVPAARVMLVEHAERFGLAQLHQLRGRVGRGEGPSWCLLHTAGNRESEAGQRLAVLEEHADGFAVAERDLQLRGPGELFGTRQSGVPGLRFAGFAGEGLKVLLEARGAAEQLLASDAELRAHPDVAVELQRRTDARAVFSGESG